MKVQSASGEKVFQFCLQKVSYDYYVAREDIDAELECNRTEINAELMIKATKVDGASVLV